MSDKTSQVSRPVQLTTVVVNGSRFEIAAPATVATLVEARRPRPPFALELNKRLVNRGAYATTPLTEGDILEIVTLVGGG